MDVNRRYGWPPIHVTGLISELVSSELVSELVSGVCVVGMGCVVGIGCLEGMGCLAGIQAPAVRKVALVC